MNELWKEVISPIPARTLFRNDLNKAILRPTERRFPLKQTLTPALEQEMTVILLRGDLITQG